MIALLVAAGMAVFLLKSRWNYRRLPEVLRSPVPAPAPSVTVIIPARDEEANIARAVASFAGMAVVVVDDASTDRTADLARAAGALVIPAPPLSGNLKGKPNACVAGAHQANTEWLLFVDADTWFEPGLVPSLVSFAERHGLALASVFPHQHCVTLAERVLLPYAFALYFCGVSAKSVNDAHGREALANGQCMLFRREAYERIGGHAAVSDSVIEDVQLAAVVKRHRLAARVLRAESLAHVRMYTSLADIWRGFEKNSFRFLMENPGAGVQVVLASVLLASWIPAILLAPWPALALAIAVLPTLLLRPWYSSWFAACLAPLAIYLFQAIAVWAMIGTLTGRKATWKGRRV